MAKRTARLTREQEATVRQMAALAKAGRVAECEALARTLPTAVLNDCAQVLREMLTDALGA